MNLSYEAPTPLEYFATLVQSDDSFPLLEAAISLGQDEYPDVDVQKALGEVDQMLARLRRRIPSDAGPMHKLRILNQFFFSSLGFGGNVNNYYDPDNSLVHAVLRTRRGIPISLAVIWLELAQSLGLAARGVGFPGHFLVKVTLPKGQVVINPFDGQSLSRDELAERLEPYRQKQGLLDEFEVPLGLYLQTARPRAIIARMLNNLKEIHKAHADWPRQIAVLDRLVILMPKGWTEYRDRGLAHAEMGHTEQAVLDLETYLRNADETMDIDMIADRVNLLRGS